MSLWSRLWSGDLYASTPSPADDFWYCPAGSTTARRVTPDQAQKLSAWYRGRDLLATSLAMLPLQVFERLPNDEGSEPATWLQLYSVLHDEPYAEDDSFGWRRRLMYDLIDEGNGYCRIDGGLRGFVGALPPFAATDVDPKRIKGGGINYYVRDSETGRTTTYSADQIFHLRGPSKDGVKGMGVLAVAADNLGIALNTEAYAGAIYTRGSLSSGVIEVPGPMDKSSKQVMAESFITQAGDWHIPKILPQGAKLNRDTLTPEQAQMLLSRQFSVDDVARWLGVPRQMLMNSDPSFGNAEQFRQDYVDFTLGPWLSLWEFAINRQLITANKYFAEFKRDALVRGNIAQRWQAYHVAVTDGVYTRNEIRRLENRNKLPGLDTPLTPAHIVGKQSNPQSGGSAEPAQPPANNQAHAIVVASVERLIRKEVAAMSKAAKKCAKDAGAFAIAVSEFYTAHVGLVAETLQVDRPTAESYCANHAKQLIEGVWAMEAWAADGYADQIARWALGEVAA